MGDWSPEPWGSGEVAHRFQRCWKIKDVALIAEEIQGFDPKSERYDQVRAAAYLLEALGNPYIWPAVQQAALKRLPVGSIDILSRFIEPPDEDWGFLDMWASDPAVGASVREQIANLQALLADLA